MDFAAHILTRGGGDEERETTSLITKRSWRSWLGKAFGRLVSRGKRKRSACTRIIRKVVWGTLENARRRSSSRFAVRFRKKIDRRVAGYDMTSYSKNFDDGGWQQEEVGYGGRSFAFRFGQPIGFDFSQL
ncbi:hypothetical protein MLD38_007130 [Melastoma candidum]|uniref:Uncharacterized protein n=1 Tax=Melastoma candidum TaxID=119954 RepID=A0ACB9RS14_9MYRT|nr:hypothetical protein MLD38_007130 [Melastoma candidum]